MLSGCTADKYDGMIVKDMKNNYYLVNWRVGELVYLSPLGELVYLSPLKEIEEVKGEN
jgi:hypothetical protein